MASRDSYKIRLHAYGALLLCCVCALCVVVVSRPKWEKLTDVPYSHGLPFLSVFFFDANDGLAVTALNLQRTADGGKTWTVQLEDEGKVPNYITFTSPTTGFIVGTERKADGSVPMVLRTEDGGRSWRESSSPVSPRTKPDVIPRLHSVSFCNESVGWAAGSDLILHTTDGGQTWEAQRSGNPSEALFGVHCLRPDMAWAVGEDGLILHTDDGGQSWSRQESGTKDTLLRVRAFGGTGWVVGVNGTLLRTRDGGASWNRLRLDLTKALADIYIDGEQGWIVGSSGTILNSRDGGNTWRPYESPTDNDLVNLFFINPKQGWAGGDRHTLLHLSD